MRSISLIRITLSLFALLSSPVFAQDWSGQVELGAVVTTGNTEQQNLKFQVDAERDSERFHHTMHVSGLRSSEDEVVTAQKYQTFYQGDYKLEGDHALFGRVSYEDDRFSGFEYQADATAGYSRSLMKRDDMTLRGDVGIGVRRSEFDTGMTETEFLTRLAARFRWQVSESARFRQLLSAEIGADSTITRSESSLESTVVGNLALKVAINIKHQSRVPAGAEKTDTESSITLVYRF